MALATCLGCLFESTHLQNFPTEYHDEETPKKKKSILMSGQYCHLNNEAIAG